MEFSETRYRTIVESQTELICRCLPDGTLTFANQAFGQYFDRPYEQLIGQNFFFCCLQKMVPAQKKSFWN